MPELGYYVKCIIAEEEKIGDLIVKC